MAKKKKKKASAKKKKAKRACTVCRKAGHNARTCTG